MSDINLERERVRARNSSNFRNQNGRSFNTAAPGRQSNFSPNFSRAKRAKRVALPGARRRAKKRGGRARRSSSYVEFPVRR
jgi:hypothetical protein